MERIYASLSLENQILEINGDLVDKVVIRHGDKKYVFNMEKILEFLCEEVLIEG